MVVLCSLLIPRLQTPQEGGGGETERKRAGRAKEGAVTLGEGDRETRQFGWEREKESSGQKKTRHDDTPRSGTHLNKKATSVVKGPYEKTS